MNSFRDLPYQEKKLQDGIQRFSSEDKSGLTAALELAKKAHTNQKRDEGDQFIIHPIRVANILLYDLQVDDIELILAGLLHDVVEDSDITAEEITQQFGERVGSLVTALTRDKVKETKEKKFEEILQGSIDAKLLKTCDWLDNLRSLPFRTDRGERWSRHLLEAREMYIPLAKAVGNAWLHTEMEKAYESIFK